LHLNNAAITEENLAQVLSLVEQRILVIVSIPSFPVLSSVQILRPAKHELLFLVSHQLEK